MSNAIRAWMIDLREYPGWREWTRQRIGHTLYFDDPFPISSGRQEDEFRFSDEVGKQHAVVLQYLGLQETINSLKECEFYFRRFPFRGLPVTRHNHITNVCEMYFGRFYEFKERLKNYFNAVKAASPGSSLDVGVIIKIFKKVFDQELRARNGVHHDGRFEDIAIDRIFLTDVISTGHDDNGWKEEHLIAYGKLAKKWAQRVRRSGEQMDEFLEVVAAVTLTHCSFLSASRSVNSKPVSIGGE